MVSSLVLSNQIKNYLYLYLFIGLSEIKPKLLSVYRDKKFHTDNGKPSYYLLGDSWPLKTSLVT